MQLGINMKIKLTDKTIILDHPQTEILKHLEDFKKQILLKQKSNNTIKIWFCSPPKIKNLYIHGQVGRGKSMLMKYFFNNLPTPKKAYFHFNSFMQKTHQELYKLRSNKNTETKNLVALATKNVIGKNNVICFDEMQVEDIADAMILKEVFSYFVKNNIQIITTSNLHPLDLYENGLQRDLFLEFINKILLKDFLILNLNNQTDYRRQNHNRHYFYPNTIQNKQEILNILLKKTNRQKPESKTIKILGRELMVKNSYQNVASFEFDELCNKNLGIADYQAICQSFSTIFLLNIPTLMPEDRNEAKRLIWFIDEAYENKIELIALANNKPEEIYPRGTGDKSFKRTASRLHEICCK